MGISVGDILIGIGLGIGFSVLVVSWIIDRIASRIEAEILESRSERDIGINVEVDNGIIYCYNSDTDQFLCQGQTLDEIRRIFEERFPNKTAYLNGGDPEIVTQWKKQLHNENSSNIGSTS
jgi:hypothetical protein